MRLKLTGYKDMACKNSIRIDVYNHGDLREILSNAVGDISNAEFKDMLGKLTHFVCSSKGEHQAIYFSIEK